MQRGTPQRGEFKLRRLDPEIGKLLEIHIQYVQNGAERLADDGKSDGNQKKNNLPLFPSWNADMPLGFEHHCNGSELNSELKEVCWSLGVVSPRTGEPIKIFATRFRRTLATRAAQEGHGELLIAELLDHEDTQNVGVYVEATPKIAERINKAMALELAPLAQAFCGLLVDHEGQASRGEDRASRVRSSADPTSFLGTCGKHGFCGGLAPICCYTCQLFQPWVDGPHEEVFDALLAERDRILDETGDERMAAVNDATIYAVGEVVQLCQARKEDLDR